jgi:hypothetical protein
MSTTRPKLESASIRRKLIALTLASILVPVFTVLFFVADREIGQIRADMLAESALMGSVVADYGAAALAFDERSAATNSSSTPRSTTPRACSSRRSRPAARTISCRRRPTSRRPPPARPSTAIASPSCAPSRTATRASARSSCTPPPRR